MGKTLYLMRHGDTGAGSKLVGSSDLALHENSYEQLAITKIFLSKIHFDQVFCSPLRRCVETRDYLGYGEKSIQVAALREIDFGEWELKSFSEIAERSPERVSQWSNWSADFCFPGGERIGDFLKRIATVRALIDECDGENILAICHGGVIRHLLCNYLGLDPENYLLFRVDAGKCTTLSIFSEGGVLSGLNLF